MLWVGVHPHTHLLPSLQVFLRASNLQRVSATFNVTPMLETEEVPSRVHRIHTQVLWGGWAPPLWGGCDYLPLPSQYSPIGGQIAADIDGPADHSCRPPALPIHQEPEGDLGASLSALGAGLGAAAKPAAVQAHLVVALCRAVDTAVFQGAIGVGGLLGSGGGMTLDTLVDHVTTHVNANGPGLIAFKFYQDTKAAMDATQLALDKCQADLATTTAQVAQLQGDLNATQMRLDAAQAANKDQNVAVPEYEAKVCAILCGGGGCGWWIDVGVDGCGVCARFNVSGGDNSPPSPPLHSWTTC